MSGFGDERGVLGVKSGVNVPLGVAGFRYQQTDLRGEIYHVASVKLKVGVDGSDVNAFFGGELVERLRLRARIGIVKP